ncbi:MarR family winged helix-turn-helix transcriptional regulator [Burkholderia sp. BCC1977]|uniref:MarR family winged helix-turn-helix transcriptional regulator n=1 Tax=Burkholderia sp. BCC1977 TaxID=2817440 RepID=UPI002ABE221D|nr:MarR family transcriptional regulator [Burkholderia sp. BCC1977]
MIGKVSYLRQAIEVSEGNVKHRARLGSLLRRLYQRNQAIWQAKAIDGKITSVQTATLGILFDEGALSLTEIGTAGAMDPATTRGVVDRLQSHGLVELGSDARDKRRVIVSLNAEGRSYVEAMLPVMDQIIEETLEALNPAERFAFEFLVRKLVEGR